MAGLCRRKDGSYFVKWYSGGKAHRKTLGTKSVQAARKRLVELEQAIEEGRAPNSKKNMTLDDFTEAYTKHLAAKEQADSGTRPHTNRQRLAVWKNFSTWAEDAGTLRGITPDLIVQYKNHLTVEKYKPDTIKTMIRTLSATFTTASKDMLVIRGANPCKGIELPKRRQRDPVYLDRAEIEKVLEAAEAHSEPLLLVFALGVFAGLRRGEIAAARWNWLDLSGRGRLRVTNENGFESKTGENRTIPLHPKLREILEPRKQGGDSYIVYPDILPKDNRTKIRCDFSQAFAKIAKDSGVKKKVTPHTLRHTFASQLAQKSVSLYEIGKYLGHSDTKTTLIYAHLAPEEAEIDF